MKIGLTMGKFLPFHQGHELMLQTAFACVDQLFVLIGESEKDPFPFKQRREWVYRSLGYSSETIDDSERLYIIDQKELDVNAPKDSDGTITDEKYWQEWLKQTKNILFDGFLVEKITHVFTSDKYGERVAKEFGAEWFPVDPQREIIKVSGTKLREDSFKNFPFLPTQVRESFVKTVALVGPESVGKSTLVPKLAERYGCQWVPEWGRTVCAPRGNDLSLTAFRAIRDGQDAFIKNAISRSNEVPLVFTDTEALVTAIYFEMYNPKSSPFYDEFYKYAHEQKIDFYLVMSPEVPWVDDGSRTMTGDQRQWFYHKLLNWLENNKKPYKYIWSDDYKWREEQCVNAVNSLKKEWFKSL